MKKDNVAVSFRDLEWDCELNYRKHSKYWHLHTDGRNAEIIFRTKEELIAGMNLLAICCLLFPDIKVFTFVLMNNHLHIILAGRKERCEELFAMFKTKLWKFLCRNGRVVDMKGFECQLIEITSLNSLRNEIAYVNRNGYVVRPDCTPFSYPWGAGPLFFNPFLRLLPCVPYEGLPVRAKRAICHSNSVELPAVGVKVCEGVIQPSCYCDIQAAESFFRSAHHYFQLLTRKFEAYGEIASRLHESVFIGDEEMYSAVCSLCMRYFGAKNPGQLSPKDRIEMARRMHHDFNASNRQIQQILKLEASIVSELFPE